MKLSPPSVLCDSCLPTENHISELIKKSSTSTCHLDPIPTTLVNACLLLRTWLKGSQQKEKSPHASAMQQNIYSTKHNTA